MKKDGDGEGKMDTKKKFGGIASAAVKVFTTFTVIIMLFHVNAIAFGSPVVVSVEPSYLKVSPGDEFTVNITVDPEENEIYGAQYELCFNNSLLRVLSQNKGSFLSQDGAETFIYINEISNHPGKTEYAEARIGVKNGVTKPGALAKIGFEVIENTGSCELLLRNVILCNSDGNEISNVIINNGTIKIGDTGSPSPFMVYGRVFYENGSKCIKPCVNLTNLNTSKEWQADTHADYNYYQLVGARGIEINASEVLRFEVTSPDGSHARVFNHTINETEINRGGLFDFNITLESLAKPDLVITKARVCWPDNCTICYNVTNIGKGTAPAGHNTTLFVDGVVVAHDPVHKVLAPGDSYIGCFKDYNWTYTPPDDNITVCADNDNIVAESNETNNCFTNMWKCGDVNMDGEVMIGDVRRVWNRYLDPNYALELPWAADVNCDGAITIGDVRKVWNRYLDPGYELNCCCKQE